MAFQDVYPEGHQGGVGIIQNGVRVATNGDLRLEPAPGQWAPVPVQKDRAVDRAAGEIVTTLAYPDPDKDRKGFNPIEYPDLAFSYKVRVRAEGAGVRVTVDLGRAAARGVDRARSASTWSCIPARALRPHVLRGRRRPRRARRPFPAPAQRPGAGRRRARGAARAARAPATAWSWRPRSRRSS